MQHKQAKKPESKYQQVECLSAKSFFVFLGIIFGTILSGALPALMGEVSMIRGGTFVSIDSMIIALSVSIIIGIIAGFVPAYQASRLKPVDALRYE